METSHDPSPANDDARRRSSLEHDIRRIRYRIGRYCLIIIASILGLLIGGNILQGFWRPLALTGMILVQSCILYLLMGFVEHCLILIRHGRDGQEYWNAWNRSC